MWGHVAVYYIYFESVLLIRMFILMSRALVQFVAAMIQFDTNLFKT